MKRFKKMKQRALRRNRGHYYLQENRSEDIRALYENMREFIKSKGVVIVTPQCLDRSNSRMHDTGITVMDYITRPTSRMDHIDIVVHMNKRPTDGSVVVKSLKNRKRG